MEEDVEVWEAAVRMLRAAYDDDHVRAQWSQPNDEVNDDGQTMVWEHLSSDAFAGLGIHVNTVDAWLLANARLVVPIVCDNVKHSLNKTSATSRIMVSDVINLCLQPLFSHLSTAVNSQRAAAHLSRLNPDAIWNYIRGLWAMSVYATTPTDIFDPEWSDSYPLASAVEKQAWWDVHRALQTRTDTASGLMVWSQPFAEDRSIREAESSIGNFFSRLLYVPGKSVLSIDDDQYRLRSALVETLGFPRHNNPKKTFGPTSTGCVCVLLGTVMCLRMSGRSETPVQTVDVLLRRLVGADHDDHVHLHRTVIALDRGYLRAALKQSIEDKGGLIVGTQKRGDGAPFHYGSSRPKSTQIVVEEDGAKSLYVAVCNSAKSFAYRTGGGSVALMYTNIPWLSQTRFILEPKTMMTHNEEPEDEPLVRHLDTHTASLTRSQGGVEWFFIRIETITSTISFTALKVFQNELAPDHMYILDIIGIRPCDRFHPPYTQARLKNLTVSRLRQILRDRDADEGASTMRKSQLIDRILGLPSVPLEGLPLLMKRWWLKPFVSSSTKVGSANELNVINGLGHFFEEFGKHHRLHLSLRRGLVRPSRSQYTRLATSPDGVIHLIDRRYPDTNIFAAVEVKTKTSHATLATFDDLRDRHLDANSRFTDCIAGDADFEALIPDPAHRCQVIHHAAVLNVSATLYVVADTVTVLYAVLVTVPDDFREHYLLACQRIVDEHAGPAQIDALPVSTLEHAVDHHTVKFWRQMKQALLQMPGGPPPAHEIVPAVVSFWNHVKGGQDVVSREMKNVKVDFRRLSPRAYIWQRLCFVCMLNAHKLWRLLQLQSRIADVSSFDKWKHLLNDEGSFKHFLRLACRDWVPSELQRAADPADDPVPLLQPPKRNRRLFFLTEDGRALRFRQGIHVQRSGNKGACLLCQYREPNGACRQCNTTVWCSICQVPLCKTRFGSNTLSCFDRFHDPDEVNLSVQFRPDSRTGERAFGRRGRSDERSPTSPAGGLDALLLASGGPTVQSIGGRPRHNVANLPSENPASNRSGSRSRGPVTRSQSSR